MKYVYVAVFTIECEQYCVTFPDFESCYTSATNLVEAMEMAKDVLTLTLYDLEERKIAAPKATPIQELEVSKRSFTSYVEADTMEYRKRYENKAVKKTLTIPSWLNVMAQRENINFSLTLQEALKKQLNLMQRYKNSQREASNDAFC